MSSGEETRFKPNDPRLIGNKFALGNRGGRPRTVSPSPEDCIELGEEMIKWVSENKPSHLSEWYSLEMFIPWKVWKNLCDMPEFSPYYEFALNLVAKNIRNEVIDKSFGNRFLGLYHRDLKQYDMDMMKYESDLKSKENEQVSETVVGSHNAVMFQLKEMQNEAKQNKSN